MTAILAAANGDEQQAFATESDQLLGMTGITAYPQKPVLEAAALEVILELLLNILRRDGPYAVKWALCAG